MRAYADPEMRSRQDGGGGGARREQRAPLPGPEHESITALMFGLFAAVSLQKTVRDRADGIPVTNLYTGIAWFALLISLTLLAVGLWNAGSLTLSEKGFTGIAFAMCLFASVAVQKNVRDLAKFRGTEDAEETASAGSPAVYAFTQPQEAQH